MRRCRAGLPPERRSLSAALPSHWLSITFRKTMTVPQDLLRPRASAGVYCRGAEKWADVF